MTRETTGARPRILVVEDEDAVRSLLSDFLWVLGYEVACATTAREALEAVRSAPPDGVLLDIRMPGEVTGDQILPVLVSLGLPVIVVSGSVDDPMGARLLEAGAVDFIAKPFALPRLQKALAQAVAVSATRAPG